MRGELPHLMTEEPEAEQVKYLVQLAQITSGRRGLHTLGS